MSAAFAVAIRTSVSSSNGVQPIASSAVNARFSCQATFSSSSRFFGPLGLQSVASDTSIPAFSAWSIRVVPPYSSRFDVGDHTTFAPTSAASARSSCVSAVA